MCNILFHSNYTHLQICLLFLVFTVPKEYSHLHITVLSTTKVAMQQGMYHNSEWSDYTATRLCDTLYNLHVLMCPVW